MTVTQTLSFTVGSILTLSASSIIVTFAIFVKMASFVPLLIKWNCEPHHESRRKLGMLLPAFLCCGATDHAEAEPVTRSRRNDRGEHEL
jgi:hypothetical protein